MSLQIYNRITIYYKSITNCLVTKLRNPLQIYDGFITDNICCKINNRIFRYKCVMKLQFITNPLQQIYNGFVTDNICCQISNRIFHYKFVTEL